MKRIGQLIFPMVFSLVSFLLYILFYSPEVYSEDMTTACLVFFAALGWSGIIFFGKRGFISYSYFFGFFSLLFPVMLFEIARLLPYNLQWHRVILLIIFAANLWLIDLYKPGPKREGNSRRD